MLTKRSSGTLPLLLFTGCARLLGIDGDYVSGVATDGTRIEAGAGGATPGASSGQAETGGAGASVASGGVVGTGGALGGVSTGGRASIDGGLDSGAGGHPGLACRAGHYSGSFDGSHRPLVTVVGVPATVSTGTVSFDLVGNTDILTIEAGKLEAKLTNVLVQDAGSMSAALTGRFDCSTRRIESGQLSGRIDLVNLVPLTISGTWEGVMDPTGAFSGTWTEHETASAGSDAGSGACAPGRPDLSQPIGSGCGSWYAR